MPAQLSQTVRRGTEKAVVPSAAEPDRATPPMGDVRSRLLALQQKAGNRAVGRLLGAGTNLAPLSVLETLPGDGHPLDGSLRAAMEMRLHSDLGAVRVH